VILILFIPIIRWLVLKGYTKLHISFHMAKFILLTTNTGEK